MRGRHLLCLASTALFACSSASFDVGGNPADDTGTGTQDDSTATTDSGVPDDTSSIDSTSTDTGGGVGDGITGDVTPSCSAPPTTATDLYVDIASGNPSVGTAACPFHHILEATTYGWSGTGVRTIHVVGGAYTETAAIVVGDRVILAGAGPDKTSITGGGSCSSGNCIVQVSGASAIHGFTVNAAGMYGIVADVSVAIPPQIFDVHVGGATGGENAAILTRGSADIGPGVVLSGNQRGIDVGGSGVVTVRAPTGAADANLIDASAQSGIFVEGASRLMFMGGEIRHGGTNGIYLNNGASFPHTITNANIHGNAASGIWVAANASAVVRSTTVAGNGLGIRFVKGSSNSIDLGTDGDHGNNVLGGASTTNTHASMCIDASAFSGGTVPAVQARGNSWNNCAPSTAAAGTCDPTAMPGYTDLAFVSAPVGIVQTDPCTVGP